MRGSPFTATKSAHRLLGAEAAGAHVPYLQQH